MFLLFQKNYFKRNEEYNWSLHDANKPKVEPQCVI